VTPPVERSDSPFLQVANAIGRRLCRDALWAGGACNWHGSRLRRDGTRAEFGRGPQPPTLGAGAAGIGLFLSTLCRFDDDPLIAATARGALTHAVRHVPGIGSLGFLNGVSGVLYAVREADAALASDAWRALDEACVRRIRDLQRQACLAAREAGGRDLSAGYALASAIPVLLGFTASGDGWPIESAMALGAVIRDTDWRAVPVDETDPAAAATHSLARVSLARALLELEIATSDRAWRTAAVDLLDGWTAPQPPAFWPGTQQAFGMDAHDTERGVASTINADVVRVVELLGRESALDDYARQLVDQTAVSLTRPLQVGDGGLSMACGATGRIEVLTLAAAALGRTEFGDLAPGFAENAINAFMAPKLPWPCAAPQDHEPPDLMFGLAGIGYFYLRLHSPATVPQLVAGGRQAAVVHS